MLGQGSYLTYLDLSMQLHLLILFKILLTFKNLKYLIYLKYRDKSTGENQATGKKLSDPDLFFWKIRFC